MKTMIHTLVTAVLLALSLPLQADDVVTTLDKTLDKTLENIVTGITSVSIFADKSLSSYKFTVPKTKWKSVKRFDDALTKAMPQAYKSWKKSAGSDSNNVIYVNYGPGMRSKYNFGANDSYNYNAQFFYDPDNADRRYVYVLAWAEKGDNIEGGIFKFYGVDPVKADPYAGWYYIQFKLGQAYLSAKGNNARVRTARLTAGDADAMLWHVESVGNGYTLTNKQGFILSCWDGHIYAGKSPRGNTLFYISPSKKGGYEISSEDNYWGNGRRFLNQTYAAGVDRLIGLWYSGDMSNIVQLVSESEAKFDSEQTSYAGNLTRQQAEQVDTAAPTTIKTGADFMEQFNNLASLFNSEADYVVSEKSNGRATVTGDYPVHLSRWTGATNKIMRMCMENGKLLNRSQRSIIANLIDTMRSKCVSGFENLDAMLEIAQNSLKK